MSEISQLKSLDKVDEFAGDNVKLENSRKYNLTKSNIKSICKGLAIDTKNYLPEKTIENIENYVKTKDKMTRILYSEISSFLFHIEPKTGLVF